MDNIDNINKFSIVDLSDIDIMADPIDFEFHLLVEAFLNDDKRDRILTSVKSTDINSPDNRALYEYLSYNYKKGIEFDNLF